MLPVVALRALVDYDPDTGLFRRHGAARDDWFAGIDAGKGYLQIYIGGTRLAASRVAYSIHHNIDLMDPSIEVDHRFGDRSNNRAWNLKLATSAENSHNEWGPRKNNKSGLLGVSWCKVKRKWRAQIRALGRSLVLGHFDDKFEAHAAYLAAKRHYHPTAEINGEPHGTDAGRKSHNRESIFRVV